ncbi:hypothetical protein BDV95DRAFT_567840 [Massariosphaeria phaeospora]|uniref:Uncharacterized protein n=1 Tax=Massariosphaeria phaeospora TaxID=100035 RepID=A0A7C8ICM8_9PLEO|nr:hypothetical protein BDV95DRAFT_567840 [Massariosphaeria phaeospora]
MSGAPKRHPLSRTEPSPESSMAVSFTSSSLALANWGFSVGDIAVLAGAGRKAGTWLFAQFKDRTLLDWMGIDLDAVLRRKGLCDTAELHERWDKKITLMKNNQKTPIVSKGGTKVPVIEDMGRFTWLMTLITAALDAAMQKSTLHELLVKFLLKLFEEKKSGEEFLRIEASQHIQGWLSAACVRSIALKARKSWDDQGTNQQHQAGFIPPAELEGIYHFLLWLVCGDMNIYHTPSTDIFCLAAILENLGLKIKTSLNKNEVFDEADVAVVWSNQLAPTAVVRSHPKFRPGMRIPLSHMEEVASLFPRSDERNKLRTLFKLGMEAVEADGVSLHAVAAEDNLPRVKGSPFLDSEQDISYEIRLTSREKIPRLTDDVSRLAGWLLPVESPAACTRLLRIIEELEKSHQEKHNVHTLAFALDSSEQNSRSYGAQHDYDYGDALNYLQAFFLGYWYQLLHPLLDTTLLESEEGFGSWSWADLMCLDFIREIVHTRMHQRTKHGKRYFMYRYEIMKLTAYLFGGAEIGQIRRAAYGAVGVIGKIPVLYSSLTYGHPKNFGKFSLLDIDASFIPSTDCGIVLPGVATDARFIKSNEILNRDSVVQTQLLANVKIEDVVTRDGGEEDFTMHIEPDWNNDSQTCVVVYRHKGRIVTRVNPRKIDFALARHMLGNVEPDEEGEPSTEDDNSPPYRMPHECEILPLSCFQGGRPVQPNEELQEIGEHVPGYVFKPIVLELAGTTDGLMNAFVCIACLYEGWDVAKSLEVISTQAQFQSALGRFVKVLVVMPARSLTVGR